MFFALLHRFHGIVWHPASGALVDDNRDAADSLATLRRSWGHYVDVAYDGTNAIALARSLKSQVLILDNCMPHLHGGELAKRLRGDPTFQSAAN